MNDYLAFLRGNVSSIPRLDEGEPGFSVDTKRLYIGSRDGNIPIGGTTEDAPYVDHLDLSYQISTGRHFILPNETLTIFITVNGMAIAPAKYTLDEDGLGFLMTYDLSVGDELIVLRIAPPVPWAPVSGNIQDRDWRDVVWAASLGLFVAIAAGDFGSNTAIGTSPDGITWTIQTVLIENKHPELGGPPVYYPSVRPLEICWSPELGVLVICSSTGERAILYSSDGVQWHTVDPEDNGYTYANSVCWSPELGIFLAVYEYERDGFNYFTSSNGASWTGGHTSAEWPYLSSVCWSPVAMKFVAVGGTNDSTGIMYSSSGSDWTYADTPGISNSLYYGKVMWLPGVNLFVALGGLTGTNTVMRVISRDGINWERLEDGHWWDAIWSPEFRKIYAIGRHSSLISNDGIIFVDTEGPTYELFSICWSSELMKFVAVGFSRSGQSVIGQSVTGTMP